MPIMPFIIEQTGDVELAHREEALVAPAAVLHGVDHGTDLEIRDHGAVANYAGSGGAVAGVLGPGVDAPELAAAYEAEGARFLRPAVG